MVFRLIRFHSSAITRQSNACLRRFVSSPTLTMASPIRMIGESIKVVDHDGITIQECVGNAATSVDELSLALVKVARPTSEPWLTIQYDEYIHVTEGCVELHYFDAEKKESSHLSVYAGQTALIEKGTRFQPRFPVGSTKYIPVCLPAFKPERCAREEGTEASEVSMKLRELHSKEIPSPQEVNNKYDDINTIYHMCQKTAWEERKSQAKAYFPPTFLADGKMTHATAEPERLISTANHFYTSSKGDWICLELNRRNLEQMGIVTLFEMAMPVGEKGVDANWEDWVFPHIYVSAGVFGLLHCFENSPS
eukprot:CCRYP_011036-RA/>CCRYP_011036-RA protein AED:0.00 eAED:0.00 QI:87/-1/1/1/-1/1/1/421/307